MLVSEQPSFKSEASAPPASKRVAHAVSARHNARMGGREAHCRPRTRFSCATRRGEAGWRVAVRLQ